MANARRNRNQQQNDAVGTGTTALAAGAGAAALSSAGGTTVVSCPPGDESFYCKFVKGFNIFKMLLFIIAIIVVIWFVYKMFFGSKGKRSGAGRR